MKMKPDLRNTLELIGIFGVIASLIFVGIQLNQDRQIAIGESYRVRAQMRIEFVLHEFDNDEHVADLARRWESGLTPSWWNDEVETYQKDNNEPMTAIARMSLRSTVYGELFENNYFQYQRGMLEEEFWTTQQQGIRGVLNNPVHRAVIFSNRVALRPETQEMMARIIEEIDGEEIR
jgi:hypothetical protein